jgi:hypothetical protein
LTRFKKSLCLSHASKIRARGRVMVDLNSISQDVVPVDCMN